MIRSNERIFLYFGAMLTGIFFLFPYIWMLLVSAKTAIMNPVKMFLTPWTAINYIKDLTEPTFYPTIINSIIVASVTTIVVLIVTIPAAYTLARYNFKGKLTILYALLGLMFFPTVAIIGPLYNFEIFLGIYNSWNGLIAPYTALAIPWGIWVLTGYFKSLPKEIEEAAELDGCIKDNTLYHQFQDFFPISRSSRFQKVFARRETRDFETMYTHALSRVPGLGSQAHLLYFLSLRRPVCV